MIIARLKKLQEESHQFANGSELMASLKNDIALRNEIEFLSKSIFHKSVSGCSNCYFDAYIQLRTLNIDTVMEKIKCLFLLLAGALLHDVVNQNNDLLCSNANITDDLALYHLKTNPACRKYFQQLPENVDELIESYELPGDENFEQKEAEEHFVSQIVTLLKNGVSKPKLRTAFKNLDKVGTVKLNQKTFDEFVKQAEVIFLAVSETEENTETEI